MKLSCFIDPKIFDMLGDRNLIEFKQFEEIQFTNNVTGDIRTFHVYDIEKTPVSAHETIKTRHPNTPWVPNLPIFGIFLGPEIKSFVSPDCKSTPQDLDKVRVAVSDFEPWGSLAHEK